MKTLTTRIQIIIFILCVSLPSIADQNFQVISDIDDTTKITHVKNKAAAAKNLLFNKNLFSGMAELFQSYFSQKSQISFVSGGVEFFRPYIVKAFAFNNLPFDLLFFRESFSEDMLNYKYEKFTQLASHFQRPIVFFGDDTEKDAAAMNLFKLRQPDYTLAIYIRRITGRALAEGVTPVFSSYEIALDEYLAGRMTEEDLKLVGKAILREKNTERVAPHFAVCPLQMSDFDLTPLDETAVAKLPTELQKFSQKVAAKIIQGCQTTR